MDPTNPAFLAWARRFGYVPWVLTEPHQREAFARHWLAWQANVPPASAKARAVFAASGMINWYVCPPT